MSQSAWDKVLIARDPERPKASDYLPLLFDNFIMLHGDRSYGDDEALIGGLATYNGIPVTILAQNKGKTLEENLRTNYAMMHPEGYRKAMRLAKQAEKFKRPIITFVDTPGAYPGKGAEERGQAFAIAECLALFSTLSVPVICIVLSEGGSGGALALSVANKVIMLEHAIYSVLSPEGFATILFKDETKAKEVSEIMKLTAKDLKEVGFVDAIVYEPDGGAQKDLTVVVNHLKDQLTNYLNEFLKMKPQALTKARNAKFRSLGALE